MGKKNSKPAPRLLRTPKVKPEPAEETSFISELSMPAWVSDFRLQSIFVAILAFLFYFNTIQNEQALDDYMVIVKNEYVYEGLAGLDGIFTKDAFQSYFSQFNTSSQLSGGRYRPLSIATFAIEQQFFGALPKDKIDSVLKHTDWGEMQVHPDSNFIRNMHVRHFFNVLWFTLSVVVLLYFLRLVVFENNPLIAFFTTVLFAIHPIHTEVVANVKSRDEILSLLFICLTFIFAFKHQEQKEKKWLLYTGLICYFLAFLSKEYAISLVVLLPLAFWLLNRLSFSQSIVAVLPYFGIAVLYIIIRLQIVAPITEHADPDILTDPYAFASGAEKLATQIATPLNYLKLLVFPHPLSSDYSYNSIPYKDFADPVVWLSLGVHIAFARAFFYFRKRNRILSFAIAFYLVNLLLVCNLLFNIGGTMGERLIYHSSLGFSIVLAYLLIKGAEMVKSVLAGRVVLVGCMLLLIGLSAYKTIARNKDWKNDVTLFTHDIKVVPNSLLVNSNVAAYMITKGNDEQSDTAKSRFLREGVSILDKVISLNRNNATSYYNKCVAYKYLNEPDSIIATLAILTSFYPNYPQIPEMYFQAGMLYLSKKEYNKAKDKFSWLQKLYPGNIDVKNALRAVNDSLQLLN